MAVARAYKRKNRAAIRKWQKQYREIVLADPVRHAKRLALARKYRKRDAEKNAAYDRARPNKKKNARSLIRKRIWRGKMKRQPCEVCGLPNADAHHHDYNKPLEIRWLCRVHHAKEHHVR